MKTRIYIDGYNLYYGALKRTPYKWLDPLLLVKNVVQTSATTDIQESLNGDFHAKLFTSKVLPKVSFSDSAEMDQKIYHQALEATYTEENFSIIYGYHSVNPVSQKKVDAKDPSRLPRDCESVDVWKIEEKQTDVNIAVEALKDAYTDADPQHMVFVSNDTDLFRLLDTLRGMPHIKVGVIAPGRKEERRPAKQLEDTSDWIRGYIKHDELSASSLPSLIRHSERSQSSLKYPLRKPLEWYGQPDIAEEIFAMLLEATGKRNQSYRWLEQNPVQTGIEALPDLPKPAIQMLDEKEDAELVKRHVVEYIKHIQNR